MDHALGWLMVRCGWRVSDVAPLRLGDMDWKQHALRIEQGKGRTDRIVSLAAAVLAALRTCLALRPAVVPDDGVLWHQKRSYRALSTTGIQHKMARSAQAAGRKARGHSLRHPCASTRVDAGAEVVSITELLGHASIGSSARYAHLSHQRVKQVYQPTIRTVMATTRVSGHD